MSDVIDKLRHLCGLLTIKHISDVDVLRAIDEIDRLHARIEELEVERDALENDLQITLDELAGIRAEMQDE